MTAEVHDVSRLFVEIGAATVLLAVVARIASRRGFSAIPLYLLAGLALGNGGLFPLPLNRDFTRTGAEIGVLLLLFMLGLESSAEELKTNLHLGLPAGVMDFVLNFTPGLVAGLLLRWTPLAALLLGGVTYISPSGIVAKVLNEIGRINNPETPMVLTVLVLEDLAMAVYLLLVGVLRLGGTPAKIAISVSIAVAVVLLVLVVTLKFGPQLSRFVAHESDQIVLLTNLWSGVAGGRPGRALPGIGPSERFWSASRCPVYRRAVPQTGRPATRPVRGDLLFFGLEIDPATLPRVLPRALALGVVTALTKVLTGYWATKRAGVDRSAGLRAGMAQVARGEFSMVIGGLGVGLEHGLGPLAAAYVLFLAILGPILARLAE